MGWRLWLSAAPLSFFLGYRVISLFPGSELLPVIRIFPGLDERTVKLADVFGADVFNKAAH